MATQPHARQYRPDRAVPAAIVLVHGGGGSVMAEAQPQGTDRALAVHEQWADGVATVTVGGDIDANTVGLLRDCLAVVLKQHPERLIINLAAVGFLDSSAIHAFTQARHVLPGRHPVVLRSPQDAVRRIIELTGIDQICVVE